MNGKEQRLSLTDVLWVLGGLVGLGSAFVSGLFAASGFAHARGKGITWPTAMEWVEVVAALLSAIAVAGAVWIAYRSLQSQHKALDRQERIGLLQERLRFQSSLMSVSRRVLYEKDPDLDHDLAVLRDQATALFGPDVRKLIVEMMSTFHRCIAADQLLMDLKNPQASLDDDDRAKLDELQTERRAYQRRLFEIDEEVFAKLYDRLGAPALLFP